MQVHYRYELTAPRVGFRAGFEPDLTPRQMLELGVFCGKYMTDYAREFPANWFTRARLAPSDTTRAELLRRQCRPAAVGVAAKGWIHPDDPRGWFQWYCRYYMGRRMPEEDHRQISRWKAIRRHVGQIS